MQVSQQHVLRPEVSMLNSLIYGFYTDKAVKMDSKRRMMLKYYDAVELGGCGRSC